MLSGFELHPRWVPLAYSRARFTVSDLCPHAKTTHHTKVTVSAV